MILLFSGGYDSALLALRYVNDLDLLIHYRYNHPSKDQELKASIKIHTQLKIINPKIKLEIIDISINADCMKTGEGQEGSRYVPSRNAIFLSIASNIAKTKQYTKIIYGAAKLDQDEYFDCTPVFINGMSKMLEIDIDAPLLKQYFTIKDMCIDEKLYNKIISFSWSCYESRNDIPCGTCNSCTQKRQ